MRVPGSHVCDFRRPLSILSQCLQTRIRESFCGTELRVNYSYDARALSAVSEQLTKAGFRLALLLNEALAHLPSGTRQ